MKQINKILSSEIASAKDLTFSCISFYIISQCYFSYVCLWHPDKWVQEDLALMPEHSIEANHILIESYRCWGAYYVMLALAGIFALLLSRRDKWILLFPCSTFHALLVFYHFTQGEHSHSFLSFDLHSRHAILNGMFGFFPLAAIALCRVPSKTERIQAKAKDAAQHGTLPIPGNRADALSGSSLPADDPNAMLRNDFTGVRRNPARVLSPNESGPVNPTADPDVPTRPPLGTGMAVGKRMRRPEGIRRTEFVPPTLIS